MRMVLSKSKDTLEKEDSFLRHSGEREADGQQHCLGNRERHTVSNTASPLSDSMKGVVLCSLLLYVWKDSF